MANSRVTFTIVRLDWQTFLVTKLTDGFVTCTCRYTSKSSVENTCMKLKFAAVSRTVDVTFFPTCTSVNNLITFITFDELYHREEVNPSTSL